MSADTELLMPIRRFVALQEMLLRAFIEAFPQVSDWQLLLNCPRSGEFVVDGRAWTFRRHGRGLRFKDDSGVVVDMHRALPDAEVFDAWRLLQYLESSRDARQTHLTEAELNATLQRLTRSGHVQNADAEGGFRFAS
jgi:hypothetical protein